VKATGVEEPAQPANRKAVITSPDLTVQHRARITKDKATSQATAKEETRSQRRTGRGTTTEPAPTSREPAAEPAPLPPRPCCNYPCPLFKTPIANDYFCATTGYPMHFGCSVPDSQRIGLNGPTFQCRSCADPSPT
jgi:hypothetical protein